MIEKINKNIIILVVVLVAIVILFLYTEKNNSFEKFNFFGKKKTESKESPEDCKLDENTIKEINDIFESGKNEHSKWETLMGKGLDSSFLELYSVYKRNGTLTIDDVKSLI